jgi:hypothetical protein
MVSSHHRTVAPAIKFAITSMRALRVHTEPIIAIAPFEQWGGARPGLFRVGFVVWENDFVGRPAGFFLRYRALAL